ncbi:MAG: glycosyltransferase family 2 protein [Bacteroidales bacterium]
MKKISLLIPAYNEEAVLHLMYERLVELIQTNSQYEWEVLFVNDGSQDNSLSILKDLNSNDSRFQYLDLSRNFGKECAMMAGLDNVSGNCVIILDADLQHPPEIIPQMIAFWEAGYEDIAAKRRSVTGETYFKKSSSKAFYRIMSQLANIPIQQDTGDFRLLDRVCIDAMKQMRETQRYTKGLYSWIGFRKKTMLFDQSARIAGESKWSFTQLTNLALEGIVSFTNAPLRISAILGFVMSFASIIYGICIFVDTMLWGDPVKGYPTLIIMILFLGGVQLLCIGIFGEYIGRVFNETKQRPPYIISEKNID